ncbi:hypothetical protein [Mycobacteroides abscessus]|uniref:hypothetical protein n=1 Tax=unclassified Desemzia TaxID=2685243 RepID=UPI0009C42922|nr:Uncharacterised protein [Mycobacteroides abscessus subsp. abscessus]
MKVMDRIIITDKNKATNGRLVGIKGTITSIHGRNGYQLSVTLENGKLELFLKDELTVIKNTNTKGDK